MGLLLLLLDVSIVWPLNILLRGQFDPYRKTHRFLIKKWLINLRLLLLLVLLRVVHINLLLLLWLLLFLLDRLGVLFVKILYPVLFLKLSCSDKVIDFGLKICKINHKFSIEINSPFAMIYNLIQHAQGLTNLLNFLH